MIALPVIRLLIGFNVFDVIVRWWADSSYRLKQNLNLARISFDSTDKAIENIFNLAFNILHGCKLVTVFLNKFPESVDEEYSAEANLRFSQRDINYHWFVSCHLETDISYFEFAWGKSSQNRFRRGDKGCLQMHN